MFFNSKEDFDKNFSQKEKSSNMVDRDINKDNKNNIITRNKELIFGNILMKKMKLIEKFQIRLILILRIVMKIIFLIILLNLMKILLK